MSKIKTLEDYLVEYEKILPKRQRSRERTLNLLQELVDSWAKLTKLKKIRLTANASEVFQVHSRFLKIYIEDSKENLDVY